MSSIPILGQQSQEKPVMPSDPVPDHFIVHASTPTLTIYAESLDILGPTIRFLGAFAQQAGDKRFFHAPNLMLFYTPVSWHDVTPPAWWKERKRVGAE